MSGESKVQNEAFISLVNEMAITGDICSNPGRLESLKIYFPFARYAHYGKFIEDVTKDKKGSP